MSTLHFTAAYPVYILTTTKKHFIFCALEIANGCTDSENMSTGIYVYRFPFIKHKHTKYKMVVPAK